MTIVLRTIFSYLEELCKQQMRLLLLDIGSWIRVTPTIHELYAHLPDLIGEGRGLTERENIQKLSEPIRFLHFRAFSSFLNQIAIEECPH